LDGQATQDQDVDSPPGNIAQRPLGDDSHLTTIYLSFSVKSPFLDDERGHSKIRRASIKA
jgi:hypothetical protein